MANKITLAMMNQADIPDWLVRNVPLHLLKKAVALAEENASQQSVQPTKAIRCACGGEMLINYRCQSCGLASPL